MIPNYDVDGVRLFHGDCLDAMRGLADCSIDAVVTDPPYGLGFMGKQWDALPPGVEWAEECLRVLKPGGHLLAFGGSRTWHRLAVAVEDAGFELRDSIAWLYGSGFPKSLDVSKAIDKAAGANRAPGEPRLRLGDKKAYPHNAIDHDAAIFGERGPRLLTHPVTTEAEQWQGWGTALKPAFEPVIVARKPLAGTVAANVQQHGTGALNIDACRVVTGDSTSRPRGSFPHSDDAWGDGRPNEVSATHPAGRWPTNVVLDESQAAELDQQTGILTSGKLDRSKITAVNGDGWRYHGERSGTYEQDSGGASRFFPTFRYQSKAAPSERPKGEDGTAHPTVKPLDLMRWLVRLVTPPGGVVLEPFAGSGTTVEACLLEGFRCIAIEREAAYLPLILQRLARAVPTDPGLFEETA